MSRPPDGFRTLAGRAEAETKERGSRFLAIAVPVRSRAEAEAFVAREERAHRDPTHVVPCFRLHDGTAWASDAGEPAGSAGPPLLAAIEGAGLADVACVVVRWHGGTKLGVGGLVRAYGGALAEALRAAPTLTAQAAVRVEIDYPHEHTAAVMRAVHACGARELEHRYGDAATIACAIPQSTLAALAPALRDATRGAVEPRILGPAVLYGDPGA